MPRRVSLPGASELFRPTDASEAAEADPTPAEPKPAARKTTRRKAVVPPFEDALPPRSRQRAPQEPEAGTPEAVQQSVTDAPVAQEPSAPRTAPARPRSTTRTPRKPAADKSASGRIRHDEKITVYVSTDELLALETARLTLRGEHGLAADRGRIVRESIAIVMADLAAHGADSELVRRLGEA